MIFFPVMKTPKLREPHVYFKYSLLLQLLKISLGIFQKYFSLIVKKGTREDLVNFCFCFFLSAPKPNKGTWQLVSEPTRGAICI